MCFAIQLKECSCNWLDKLFVARETCWNKNGGLIDEWQELASYLEDSFCACHDKHLDCVYEKQHPDLLVTQAESV